ncbi:hypothetical protein BJ165DRAFT_18889 [Panaeolus papilionaceus]|nr:hypothetical protein BJ165DRAFT_18889 [Panaeolus papilionaceus]
MIQPPPEVWNEIFLRCLPPPELVDTSRCFTMSNSPWNEATRQKKAIVQVCWSWYEIGLPLLYEDICIFRPHQLPLLLEAMKESRYRTRRRIKRVLLSVLVPDRLRFTFLEHLRNLVELSPSLISFDFRPCQERLSDWKNTGLYFGIRSNITHLTLTEQVPFDVRHDILSSVTDTLTHLNVYDFGGDSYLTFPMLVDFTLHATIEVIYDVTPEFLVSKTYTFPIVERLTIVLPKGPLGQLSIVPSFCKDYSASIRMLQIQEPQGMDGLSVYSSNRFHPLGIDRMQPILDSCPMLEHLILHPAMSFPIKHPRVQWVDIWEPTTTLSEPQDYLDHFVKLKDNITKEHFPNLKGLRTLGLSLERLYPSIPVTFAPSASYEPHFEPCEFKFGSSLHVRHEASRIFCPPLQTFYGSDEDDSDDL